MSRARRFDLELWRQRAEDRKATERRASEPNSLMLAYHLEGYSPQQIAGMLRIPVGDVRRAVEQMPTVPRNHYRRTG